MVFQIPIIFVSMILRLDHIKTEFADLENSLRTWCGKNLDHVYPWEDQKMSSHLQQVYQLTHEAVCILDRMDRICFEPYGKSDKQPNMLHQDELTSAIADIRLCWACSDMMSWRELSGKEKAALIFLEQLYQYIIAYSFGADLYNVTTVTEDYLDSFRNE